MWRDWGWIWCGSGTGDASAAPATIAAAEAGIPIISAPTPSRLRRDLVLANSGLKTRTSFDVDRTPTGLADGLAHAGERAPRAVQGGHYDCGRRVGPGGRFAPARQCPPGNGSPVRPRSGRGRFGRSISKSARLGGLWRV